MNCFAHPSVRAVASCGSCFRPVCEVCETVDGAGQRHCPDCARRKARLRRDLLGLTLALIVGGGIGVWVMRLTGKPHVDDSAKSVALSDFDYGWNEHDVRRLVQQMEREPCDRRTVIELCETMLRSGDSRGTLRHANHFFATCGEFLRLRWLTHGAHNQVGEFEEAAADVTLLIASEPHDSKFHGWRGLVREQQGELERAAEDFRQALLLQPNLSDLPFNLAGVLERQGKPCDAIPPLAQALFFNPGFANIGEVHARIERLGARPECAWVAGEGQARIPRQRGQGVTVARVRINDRLAGRFVVDTGATWVVLSRKFADRLRLSTQNAPKFWAQTANGPTQATATTIERIDVQGVRAAQVPAAVVDELGDTDGLLGMSFLSRFDIKQTSDVLELAERKR